jgi:histidinol-phosphate aminotransferase
MSLTLRIRPALENLPAYSAGRGVKEVGRELGLEGRIVKLASNEGPFGPFPAAEKAIAEALQQTNRYPDAGFRDLREALAAKHDVSADRILVGAGLCAVIHHLAVAFLDPGDEVAYCSPTFTAYRLEAIKMGARPVEAPLTRDGAYDLEALASAVNPRTKLVYVSNPNNPTGNIVTRDRLSAFLEALPDSVLPVLDEAYFEYVEHQDYPDGILEFAGNGRPVVVMRTFSKIYGLAGLRVGYAVGPADVVRACSRVQNSMEVNRVALAAAQASLEGESEVKRRRAENRANRGRLVDGLRALDYEPLPSEGNFVHIHVGDGAAVAAALEKQGVIVRPLASMGNPSAVRVTVGTAEEVDIFLKALRELPAATRS